MLGIGAPVRHMSHSQRGLLMPRVQLALNVDDLDAAIKFYSTLFDTAPAKVTPGYANFAVVEPPLKFVTGEPRPGRHHQPPRRGSGLQRNRAHRDRSPQWRRIVHRRGDRHHLLLIPA